MATTNLKSYLSDIADAIRYAKSSTGLINARMFNERIKALHGGQPVPPEDVPQTGTWQYKTTPSTGFIIIGKDDDTADQAIFVRMVNGYGFPVTINTMWETQYDTTSHKLTSDDDTDISLYPPGSVSRLPNGGTVHDLNMIIIENNLGEVAQHGSSAHSIWDSRRISDSVMEEIYQNYVTGGGTKSKTELLDAMKEIYADSDMAQGGTYITDNRANLENDLGAHIYTLGCWGATTGFEVDGITVCPRSKISVGSYDYARELNYWGDGIVSNFNPSNAHDPYRIARISGGLLNAENVSANCQTAYKYRTCIELFTHQFWAGLGTSEQWQTFKDNMDMLKSWVEEGKIRVVTRYQYSQLGEFVENPIVSLSILTDEIVYKVGDTITENNITCKAVLQDGTEVICDSDRILDLSQVNTSEKGTYPISLEYRGFNLSINVTVVDEVPQEYLINNLSFSGDSILNGGTICDILIADFAPVAGKKYHFEYDFKANTTVKYNTHNIKIAGTNGWSDNASVFDSTEGVTSTHLSYEVNCIKARNSGKLFSVTTLNTTINEWELSNLYCWEVKEGE